MKIKPLLTIVTVTKNCVDTIGLTLDSIGKVKDARVEYIIVDGVSTDGTLEKIYERRNLVDLILSEPDNGIYNAMNKGAALASGCFVLFLNGDDEFISSDFLALIDILGKNKNKKNIICTTTLVGDRKLPSENLIAKPRYLPFFNSVPHPSSFIPRELLSRWKFSEDLKIVSDYDFFLRCYMSGIIFKIYPYTTALHQRGGASGNTSLSLSELEIVRKDRLGMLFPFIQVLAKIYRYSKKIFKKIL
jgi:glycosyltransferase involved in cell wall biosynthesis